MWVPFTRRPPALAGPEPADDETTRRLAVLAEQWQADPGVTPWPDEHTALIPVVTPAARLRGWGQ